jgi:hypothetical protein
LRAPVRHERNIEETDKQLGYRVYEERISYRTISCYARDVLVLPIFAGLKEAMESIIGKMMGFKSLKVVYSFWAIAAGI